MKIERLKKKNKSDFIFFQNDVIIKKFFENIYAMSIDEANKYVLKHCLEPKNIEYCNQMNGELFQFCKNKIRNEKYEDLFYTDCIFLQEKVEQGLDYSSSFEKKMFLPRKNKILAKQYFEDYKKFYESYLKRQNFLKECELFINQNEKYFKAESNAYLIGGVACSGWLIVSLLYRAYNYKKDVNAKYNEIYEGESARLKDNYAQEIGYESSEAMQSYFNSFLVEVGKQDVVDKLAQTYENKKSALAEDFGFSSAEELQNLINDSVKELSRTEYSNLLTDKYNLNLKLIAQENGFENVGEMNSYLDKNVIYTPARSVYTYPVWRKIPERYEYKTQKAEQVYLQKKELDSSYKKEMNNLPRRNETVETVSNPTLSVANDKLESLEDDYLNELDKINKDDNFPRLEYSTDSIKFAVENFEDYKDTLPTKINEIAKSEVDFDCDVPMDIGVPAVSFSCLVFALKMVKNVKLSKEIKERQKAFSYINKDEEKIKSVDKEREL